MILKTPQEEQQDWIKDLRDNHPMTPCSLNEPLMRVIPNEGVIIPCQRHPQGHFITPSVIISC